MKPTGKMEKSESQMGSDFSVFPVGFISNLFHIYHSHICSFRGSWLVILKFVKSTLVFNHQFLLRHLQFLILSYTVTSLLEKCLFFSFVYYFCLPQLSVILKITVAMWGRNKCVNAFAIFIYFSAQFNSGMDQSDTPKTTKFISRSLFTSLFNFITLSFSEHHQKLFNILHNLFLKTVEVYFPCSTKKTILIYLTISM